MPFTKTLKSLYYTELPGLMLRVHSSRQGIPNLSATKLATKVFVIDRPAYKALLLCI